MTIKDIFYATLVVIYIGLVPKTIAFIPWTTPPVIGGFLSTGSWRGGALAAVNFVIAVVIYLPFVKLATRNYIRKQNDEQNNEVQER